MIGPRLSSFTFLKAILLLFPSAYARTKASYKAAYGCDLPLYPHPDQFLLFLHLLSGFVGDECVRGLISRLFRLLQYGIFYTRDGGHTYGCKKDPVCEDDCEYWFKLRYCPASSVWYTSAPDIKEKNEIVLIWNELPIVVSKVRAFRTQEIVKRRSRYLFPPKSSDVHAFTVCRSPGSCRDSRRKECGICAAWLLELYQCMSLACQNSIELTNHVNFGIHFESGKNQCILCCMKILHDTAECGNSMSEELEDIVTCKPCMSLGFWKPLCDAAILRCYPPSYCESCDSNGCWSSLEAVGVVAPII